MTLDPKSPFGETQRENMHQPWEVAWRCKKWGCSPLELEHAVAAVGNSVEKIEERLTALGQKRK
jgi:hypothetical protein